MCTSKRQLITIRGVGVALTLTASISAPAHAATPPIPDTDQAIVTTARIDGGIDLPLVELTRIARERGTVERLVFDPEVGPHVGLTRTILHAGEPEHRYPGFWTELRPFLEESLKNGAATLAPGGLRARMEATETTPALDWTLPRQGEPLRARLMRDEQTIAADATVFEGRSADGALWPILVRVDAPGRGGSLVQILDYEGAEPARLDPGPYGCPIRRRTVIGEGALPMGTESLDGPIDYAADEIDFHYSLTGLSFHYDSGWQPPGNSEPGGWPMQLQMVFGAGFDISSNVSGELQLDRDRLMLGDASGDLLIDFGAEMWMKGAFDFYIIDPIVVSLPYVPYYDLRVYDTEEFDSFLLGSAIDVSDAAYGTLLSIPIFGVPWIVTGGVSAKAAVVLEGNMTAESIETEDGLEFSYEGQSHLVYAPGGSYHTNADYNEYLELGVKLWVFPKGWVKVFGFGWNYELPLGVEWEVLTGQYDMDFNSSPVDFELVPGDLLWSFPADTLDATRPRGTAALGDVYWITSGSGIGGDNYLYKFDTTGNLLLRFPQPIGDDPEGWGDLAQDGAYLYGSAGETIEQIDPASGAPTGVIIPGPFARNRALAYDPASDHFWVASIASNLVEIDRTGTEIARHANSIPATGLAWDNAVPDSSWLWVVSDGDSLIYQFDPRNGVYTGLALDCGTPITGAGSYIRETGAFLGVDLAWPQSVFGMKLNEGFVPDTVYVGLIEATANRSYAMPGDRIGVTLRWKYENTIDREAPADVVIDALLAKNVAPGYQPSERQRELREEVLPGIYESRFDFELTRFAPLDSSGVTGGRVFFPGEGQAADTLLGPTFTVGINPEAGSISGSFIHSGTGLGVERLRVALYRSDGEFSGNAVATDSSGSFLLEHVDPGSYYLEAVHPWFAATREPEIGTLLLEPLGEVARDSVAIDEIGMAYIQAEPQSPSQFLVSWYPTELNVNHSMTYLSDYRFVEDLKDEPTEGYFFAFEDEDFGWSPGYIALNFDLPSDASLEHVGLEWNAIAEKYLWDNVFAYYLLEGHTIWNGRDKYIYDTAWIDYAHVAPGSWLRPGSRNHIRFGATNESDWSEHIVDTMRWNLYGWHPDAEAGVGSMRIGCEQDEERGIARTPFP